MARSGRKLLLLLAAALASGAVAAPPQQTTQPAPPPALQPGQQPITLDAASSEVDYRTNTVVFSEVVISQGATRVQADHAHATGLNFANSRWTFEGKVRIDAEQHGNLRSDQATVDFRNNRIARATITGKPAEFEQKRADSEQMARGHADEIVYDLSDGTVRLSNEAWLTDGQNEISGPLLVYNVRAQRVEASASPGTDQRVHITIAPREVPGPGKTEPAKPPPPDPGKADPVKPQPTAQP
jgi:lipopolysaccharide transport protein LptA